MKDFMYYGGLKLHYPQEKDYTHIFMYDNGQVIFKGTWWDFRNKKGTFPPTAVKQEVLAEEAFEKAKKEYNEEIQKRFTEFKQDLEKEFGVEGNPKADLLFAKAWEFGDSNGGYSEAYNYYEDLVDLIR